MKVEAFAKHVRAMRDAQDRYYSLPKDDPEKQPTLRECKQLEANVDHLLDEILGSNTAALFH
jgi:hypothetical protein